jgi:Ca2+-binding EF-hand superfamily protein
LNNVSRVETIERDYTPQGVQFYYLYKQLAHPELDHYVDPFTLEERLMHVKQAEVQLGSRIPWIADAMTNELKHALGDMPNSEFIIDPYGRVVVRRAWSDPTALREDLERLVGPVENPTRLSDLELVTQPAVPTVAKGIVPRVELPGRMATLRVEPMLDETDYPFYTKLRADVDRQFLQTGHGTLYLGFHIDPLYHMHWNNEAPPLEYEVLAAEDVQVTPAAAAFAVVEEPADADPREFLVDIRADDRSHPLDVSVTYYACDDANTFCVPVTQRYAVHLEIDLNAGRVFGAGRPGLAAGRFGGRGPDAMVDRMMTWDANEDGVLTRDESPERMRDRFDSIDVNGDGMLERDELENMSPPGRGGSGGGRFDPGQRLRQFDADGDGRITREELPDRMERMVDRFDANGDGVLDTAELEAMTERMSQRPSR